MNNKLLKCCLSVCIALMFDVSIQDLLSVVQALAFVAFRSSIDLLVDYNDMLGNGAIMHGVIA